jgi:hypothetical protein
MVVLWAVVFTSSSRQDVWLLRVGMETCLLQCNELLADLDHYEDESPVGGISGTNLTLSTASGLASALNEARRTCVIGILTGMVDVEVMKYATVKMNKMVAEAI